MQDVRYGLRSLGRGPLFTLTATATLALGLGAVSTVVTLGDALLYRPLPAARPESVVEVVATRNHGTTRGLVSYPDYEHFRDATTLEALAAYYPTAPLFVTVGNRAREVTGSVVSWNFFPLLGVRPASGRAFLPSEDSVPGRDPVAVVSDAFSRDWLGGPAATGARIDVNGVAFTVIGVLAPEFHGLHPNPSQIFIPTMMLSAGYRWCDDALAEDCTILRMIGRLAPGQSVESARAVLAAAVPPRWAQAAGDGNSGVTVITPRGIGSDGDRRMVELLAWVSGLLLLVCCANLTGLLIARGAARVRELAVRTSLGASPGRLVRQLLTESMLLAAAGGALGVALSAVMTGALDRWFFSLDNAGRPMLVDFGLQPRVVGVALAITVAAGLLFGLAPALGAIRAGAAEALKRRSAADRSNTGRWLLGGQVALAVVLVSTAGLLVASARTFVAGRGFDPSQVAQVRLRPRLVGYSPERAQAFLRAATERLRALPGVEAVSLVGTGGVLSGLEAEVGLPGVETVPTRVGAIEVGARYFEVVGTPVLRGREFEASDRGGAPAVAIVSRSLGRLLWQGLDPLDRIIVVDGMPRSVVGVVEDVSLHTRAEAARPYVFLPFWQNPSHVDARVPIRVSGDLDAALPTLSRAVHAVDPAVPITDVITLPAQLAGSFRPVRMSAAVAVYAGGLAVLVCAIGLYGALAFAVSARTREIGIRMAIGADPRRILRTFMGEAMPVIALGVAGGVVLSFAAARVLGHMLAGAAGGDMLAYGAAASLVAGVGLAAGWIPARRAARLEPTLALRQE